MTDYVKQLTDAKSSMYDLLSLLSSVDGGGDISGPRFSLIGGVKIKIDEVMPEGEGIQFDVDGLTNTSDTLDLLINALLDESAVNLHQIAPAYKINGKTYTGDAVSRQDGTGYVVLPADYMRLLSFKMVGWQRSVTEPITLDDPRYKLQCNSVFEGRKVKPVCVLTQRKINETVTRILDYYSLLPSDSHEIEEFVYIASVLAEEVQDNLIETLLWICASKVLQISGRVNESKLALEQVEINLKNLK